MQTEAVLTVAHEDGIATFTLNKPKAMNVVDFDITEALRDACRKLPAQTRVVVLKANGPAFSGGGNIRSMQENMADIVPFLDRLIDSFHGAIQALRGLPVPLICAVQGAAAGGGLSLALAGDLVVAGESAKFVVAYPKLAVSCDGGLSYALQRRIGPLRAQELMLTNAALGAPQALSLGLVTQVVADDQVAAAAETLAKKVAALPPQAIREIKGLFSDEEALHRQLNLEKAAFLRCAAKDDFRQAVEAFLAR
ncbi:hypothetical protein B9N43_00750 [Denitratisoma sp. DHT3]|uniref:enoyl-CoA hydratase/isomerase family protein n=1 Tax=Denitratisoma sp. DHT3 TaxID=1981880 RepID=UPI0011988496|nr:enoyl-CoA hydratase-related protein [Denitratisoma sp. DHT3]QDX79907.1 hypothetical protein B9N43_00750 [Denitratisoma sp. DHT3]